MPIWRFGNDRGAAARALLLAEALFEGPQARNRSVPFALEYRVCGVGLFARNETDVVPALYIETEGASAPLSAVGWRDVPDAYSALTAVFGENLEGIGEVVAVRVPSTTLHTSPGDITSVAGQSGLLGAPVTWSGGSGYLTAGHVGQANGMSAADSGGAKIGNVVFVRTGSSATAGGCATFSVDVAVIGLTSGVTQLNTRGISGTAVPSPRAPVVVFTRSGNKPAVIYGAAQWWWVSRAQLALTQIYISGSAVTKKGDSGGPVVLAKSPGSVIGHVIGGNNVLSCFQDADHQLAEIRTDPAFSSISI